MLSHLLYIAVAIGYLFAAEPPALIDPSCTVDGKYTKQAVSCENSATDDFCNIVFGDAPKVGSQNERNVECYQANGVLSASVKHAVIEICARTCGFCCLKPEYDCANNGNALNCETVTEDQCKDPKWREVLLLNCPAMCGFCLESGRGECVDEMDGCENHKSICRNIDYFEFAEKNCKKTCGYCNVPATSPGRFSDVKKSIN